MILRGAVLALVLVTALLVQTVVAPAAAVAGIVPDLVVLTVLALGLLEGPGTGLRYGFAAGLVVDLLASGETILGTSALVFLLVGYAAGAARPYLAANELLGQTLASAVGSAAVVLLSRLLEVVLGVDGPDLVSLLLEAVGAAAWAVLLAAPLLLLLRGVLTSLPDQPQAN